MPEFPGLETVELEVAGDMPIFLHRKPGAGGVPVLLIHGASARHETFTIPCAAGAPDGKRAPRCLADWLAERGMEPWLLDWRGSGLVGDALGPQGIAQRAEWFDFDRAAQHDLPAAFEHIRRQRPEAPIVAVGHCMGAGVLAQAIASGRVTRERHGLTHAVLLTLGLFYEPPLDSRLKVQDHLLERLLERREGVVAIDPREKAFPEQLERLYESWPDGLRPHPVRDDSAVHRLCDRIAFMYGTPYLERNLVPEIHAEGREDEAELPRQFGAIPLRMYVHGARNSRRGWAAGYEAATPFDLVGPEVTSARERFDALEGVTLITGDRNQLWHRDSVDRMFEWLRRGPQRPGLREKYVKKIERGYGHQDLLWGRNAWRDVFPDILDGLRIASAPGGPGMERR